MIRNGLFSIYTTKPGDQTSATWRWALTNHGTGLTRREAARLADSLKAVDQGTKVICYGAGDQFAYAR